MEPSGHKQDWGGQMDNQFPLKKQKRLPTRKKQKRNKEKNTKKS